MNLQKKLAAYFLPTRRLIGTEAGQVQQGGVLGGRQWVVPRMHCQYRQLDLGAIPARQREAAARLAAARYLPAPEAACHIAWRQGVAHFWIWTEAPAEARAGEQQWLPESLLVPLPETDGPRLLRLAEGVEGQVWSNRQLITSQWWPQLPGDEPWLRFLRSAGMEQPLPLPPAQAHPWLDQPWGERRRSWLPGTPAARERLAWVGGCALLAFALGWQLTAWARWNLASSRLVVRLEATRAEAAPILAARERAEQMQAEALHLLELQQGRSDYRLMAQVAQALPEGTLIHTWRREPNKITTVVSASQTDPRKYVAAFAGVPGLAEVTATPVGGRMQLVFAGVAGDGQEGDG
ncbi:hypothetical protein [Pseudoxanthomonas mexicana]|uniref:hypothetical protein n=1 Tax=Pseudoxanthomonas mexicana TaxID=128785 RepID=UPI00398B004E